MFSPAISAKLRHVTHSEELASLPLSERIAKLISDARTDQEGFAAEMGAPRETVNRWLNHHARPGREYRQKLADYASRLYGETIGPDMFREYVTDRPTPIEAAAAQLVETGQALEAATRALVALLAEQREVVERMQQIEVALAQREAANEAEQEQR